MEGIPVQLGGDGDDDVEITRLVEFPLRSLVMHEEVCSGLWPSSRHITQNANDINNAQTVTLGLRDEGAELTYSISMNSINEFDIGPRFDPRILCALVSPYVSGTTETGGKQYTEVTARHHLRQRLAVAGQLTMSYARDPRLDKFTNTLAVPTAFEMISGALWICFIRSGFGENNRMLRKDW
ncbi:hypothetical protein Pmar_PMAR022608 [Perkinsus marinus ATCC 50983]|uniref:Uncharacterized protein n=1 Tax=Perkinsus marinus (strain ATCC 50983 / TXsc) TaxID=423536 RepID=C5KFK9_PERM5|nr:hypothetical protein Pmar_PMAR022608 [Perkinsus marinus ATCC 50983]EER16758.1 hypothetical protein Pmar_PMAR022608 [Perkinsus marinus ATCC 50983]|eukprot:XP_002784962.1 hypothetical protein Pmar_PMAR022608 [Perkinsus marinus ATCC 50983]